MNAAAVMEAVGSPTSFPRRDEPARVLRVAQVITRLSAGAGGVALRGALALDPARYESTILTSDSSDLIEDAEAAGLEVVRLRSIATGRGLYPGADRHGYAELVGQLGRRRFDLVHTHSAKAGALGRLADRLALDGDAQDVLVAEAVDVELAHACPDAHLVLDETIASEVAQRLAHGSHAHAEGLGDAPQGKTLPGPEVALDDLLAELPIGPLA